MKTVLITGANKGIGFETARQLAILGYYVYIGSRNKSKGLQAVEQLRRSGLANIDMVQIDVTDINSIRSARLELDGKIQQLDILINNAGIAGDQPQNISTVNIDILRKVFDTNFFGAVQTTQEFLTLLKKSGNPRIINVSSNLASLTLHTTSQNPNLSIYDAYSCSKTALNAFTVLLAKEFRNTTLKVNSVAPGYTATDLNQFQGRQTVEQAARIVVKYAALDNNETGKYFKDDGENDW